MEPIEFGEIEKVNTFSRMELMKEKTREMTGALVRGKSKPDDWTLHKLCQEYDMLALDWVYSDRLEWEGSLPDKQVKRILERALAETL
jgi:hypothetical protein